MKTLRHSAAPWVASLTTDLVGRFPYYSIWAEGLKDSDCNIGRTFKPSSVKEDDEVKANAILMAFSPRLYREIINLDSQLPASKNISGELTVTMGILEAILRIRVLIEEMHEQA